VLCADSVLNPNWAILIVGSRVEVVSGTGRKHTSICIIHF
jgi:hypothetical protein